MDGTKTRTSGGKTLSSGKTAPLKPTPGLSGPPDESSGQPWSGCGAVSGFRFTGMWSCRSILLWFAEQEANTPLAAATPNAQGELPETAQWLPTVQGSFDCETTSLREVVSSLRMTTYRNVRS